MVPLEGEENRGEFHFHKVEIDESKLETVLNIAKKKLKDGWYFHLVKGNLMKVVFRGKVFEVLKGQKEEFEKIRKYGLSIGIRREQLMFERLIENPYDE